MGFVERNDAFDFNVTIQEHVKHVHREAQAAAAAAAPAEPPKDYTLKGNMSIALPSGHMPKTREIPKGPVAPGGMLLAPPPNAGGGGNRRRPVGVPAAPVSQMVPAAAEVPANASLNVTEPFGFANDPFSNAQSESEWVQFN